MTMETSLKQCTMPNVSLRFDDSSIPTSQWQWIWVLQLNNEDCLIVVRSLCWSPSDALQLQAISQGTNFSPFTRCECQCSVPPNSSMINMRNNLASCPITKTLPQRLNTLNKINNQALESISIQSKYHFQEAEGISLSFKMNKQKETLPKATHQCDLHGHVL